VGYFLVRFEVVIAVAMTNAVFWDVASCGSCNNRHFGGWYHLHYQSEKNELLVTANVVPSLLILFTLTMEGINSSEMSVLTRAT
jgi:hypothetical protein